MKRRKQKSSGWRPSDKRRPWAETKARVLAAQRARFKADSDRLGLWRSCPAALCRRRRACAADPYRCTKQRGSNAPAKPGTTAPAPPAKATGKGISEEAKQANQQAPRFAISAKEAAARIKADVAAHVAALGDDPDGILRGGF